MEPTDDDSDSGAGGPFLASFLDRYGDGDVDKQQAKQKPLAAAIQEISDGEDVWSGADTPEATGAPADAMPADGIVEDQHFLDVADYVGGLKARLDKLASATSALVKHAQLTGSVLMEFARVVVDLDETEAKAKAVFGTPGGVQWTDEIGRAHV